MTPAEAIEERTQGVESAIREAHAEALAARFPSGLALVAVGGFGRRELFPFSDVDLLVLVDAEPASQESRDALSRFLQLLWDRELRMSHSVRTPAECVELHENNTELNISLLDQRYLTGDDPLYRRMSAGLPRFLHARGTELARHLVRLTRARHAKFRDSIYHLEPNIKETPGGLRDLHVVHWLSRLRREQEGGAPDPALEAARDFLFDLRLRLHRQSGRDNNVLSFDSQESLSDKPAETMRQYFRHARVIHRAALQLMEAVEAKDNSLLAQFRDWRSRVSTTEFTVSRDRVYLRSPQQLQADPLLIARLFQFSGRHGLRLSLDTGRRISDFLAASGPVEMRWAHWRAILSQPHTVVALRAMQETGALAALLPEWGRIECLVVRDFYHRYTVDEHTLVAIETLDALPDRRFSELCAEAGESMPALRFAFLLHDIGKGSGHEHVAESLRIAALVMARIEMPEDERATVGFLIEHHLDLSSVMNARDLDDLATARDLAQRIGTLERLRLLTLMSFADIAAVHPTAMSPWRVEQLWRVYLLAHEELTRELETERIQAPATRTPEMAAFLEGFPTRYVRTHTEADMEAHLAMARESAASGIALDLKRHAGAWLLTLAARDREGLFSAVAGTLAGFGMNILKAEAFANRQGIILDTFTFADPLRTLELNPPELDRLRDTLARVASGKQDVAQLLKHRRKPHTASRAARVNPKVAFNNDASQAATLIEIVAGDRPGLLYDLSGAITAAGCNIEVVLIDTEAHKALDVFYVTHARAKLSAEKQAELQARLLAALSE
ncbi:MAG: nucleotidyltransferase domain-containing protein [Bryobacteraceae bacterium]